MRKKQFKVTDPLLDAPDGAVVDGFERVGGQWVPVAAHRDEDVQLVSEKVASMATTLDGRGEIFVGGRRTLPTVRDDECSFKLPEKEPPGWADP